MDADISFDVWLQKRRKALDLTPKELAQRAGCSVSVLCKIQADLRRPSKQLAELLANALDISADEHITFVKIARGELSIERLKSVSPLPGLSQLQPSPDVIQFHTNSAHPVDQARERALRAGSDVGGSAIPPDHPCQSGRNQKNSPGNRGCS